MSVVVNEVRRATYLDSVALMRIAAGVRGRAGVEEAGLMIGTPANLAVLAEAGLLADAGALATAGDLVLAVRATTAEAAEAALVTARSALAERRSGAEERATWRPRTLGSALAALPGAGLALVSVPGAFAAAEAHRALAAGLDVMIFSDNVPLADEIALKQAARRRGRLVMGPDCGTAIIAGVPIAFANVVPRGDIGIVGASGTGIQEVSCLIARAGRGISHAIGTGGRDLAVEVGAATTLAAIDLLDADPATRHVVVVSKPPAPAVAAAILARIGQSAKTFTVCFIGGAGDARWDARPGASGATAVPGNARLVPTLAAAAEAAAGAPLAAASEATAAASALSAPRGPFIAGLFAGGTLAAEAQVVLMRHGLAVASNAPVPGAARVDGRELGRGNTLLDLGDDRFTRGRPHPMIEPAVRDAHLAAACADHRVGVVLLDLVLGFGSHPDPAGHVAGLLAGQAAAARPIVVASVTGTDGDPQGWSRQVATLRAAGVVVAPSNAAAAALAADLVAGPRLSRRPARA